MPASSKTGELLDSGLRAHGGVDRWNTFEEISADFVTGGGLMPMKGMNLDPRALEGTATIHHESTVITPFGEDDQRLCLRLSACSLKPHWGRSWQRGQIREQRLRGTL